MRILHTSDLHLGMQYHGLPRDAEQSRMLDWLAESLERERVDLLVIAGDVFDQPHPPSEAQQLYYGLLAKVARGTPCREVVIVGGNHDSPARMDAPAEVLRALRVRVVGGVRSADEVAERCLMLVKGADGAEVAIAAVPYVSEYRLGVSAMEGSEEEVAVRLRDAIGALYARAADAAEARFPGVPLLGMGHLAVARERVPVEDAGSARAIHVSSRIGALPSSIFDDRYRYVALGHLHRAHRVAESRAWYSGTPVPCDPVEKGRRYVQIVDIASGADPQVRALEVPQARRLIEVKGRPEEVVRKIGEIEWSPEAELPPYLSICATVDDAALHMERAVGEAVKARGEADPIRIGSVSFVRETVAAGEPGGVAVRRPEVDLNDAEAVFRELVRQRQGGREARDELIALFREVVAGVEQEERADEARAAAAAQAAGAAPAAGEAPAAKPVGRSRKTSKS